MRIIFLGSPSEVLPVLEHLVNLPRSEHQLVAVVSQPSRPFGRKRHLKDPPVAERAKELGILTLQPEKAREARFLAELHDLKPDLMITAAYGQILSEEFLAIPKRGTINLHPSLLPKWRGATPVQSALWNGETQTGISILFTVKKLDAGAIIAQEATEITANETASELMTRLFARGTKLLESAFTQLAIDGFTGQPQDETQATHCKKIAKEDGAIRWGSSAAQIFNQFRACQPWPGVFSHINTKRIVITTMSLSDQPVDLKPGHFVWHKPSKSLLVGTGAGQLRLEGLKPEGSKALDALAFWNGQKIDGEGTFHE